MHFIMTQLIRVHYDCETIRVHNRQLIRVHYDCKTNNDTFHNDTTALCSDKDKAGNPTFELLSLLSCISLISRTSRWRDEEIEMEEMEMVGDGDDDVFLESFDCQFERQLAPSWLVHFKPIGTIQL